MQFVHVRESQWKKIVISPKLESRSFPEPEPDRILDQKGPCFFKNDLDIKKSDRDETAPKKSPFAVGGAPGTAMYRRSHPHGNVPT